MSYNIGMKLTKAEENKLIKKITHITGECGCSSGSTTCDYWKYVDKGGENWQAKLIVKLIKSL